MLSKCIFAFIALTFAVTTGFAKAATSTNQDMASLDPIIPQPPALDIPSDIITTASDEFVLPTVTETSTKTITKTRTVGITETHIKTKVRTTATIQEKSNLVHGRSALQTVFGVPDQIDAEKDETKTTTTTVTKTKTKTKTKFETITTTDDEYTTTTFTSTVTTTLPPIPPTVTETVTKTVSSGVVQRVHLSLMSLFIVATLTFTLT